ncbi:potassium/proton antiporter [Citromicrobium sp. RCC1885]|uniref:potassium/proton antiporter n=1 Tax=unclassified Citromicrobium TaxID=2630544 RepID=UPI0006C8F67C|nr:MULTISPECIES: potassium/proton antiporter [unclassified Citromicrobium]KPM25155.1 potassium/proton antiporter [Citromicrobium sp. RCC1885]KPM28396.1 potassium/proton antiporter [Citromicrobium sp. RCC1878]MAO04087.1 potassium/proton antiporter [Citromicrobium sp.]OAM10070.1 potassium:proton antiporter [Citromicrobium sp. RCC1897]|tara:strand:- start:1870 stop:3105 length:1236 start_codon:yes stop_codon:yes gene_type:complete
MLSLSPEVALLVLGILLLATVFAGSISSRFGLPALIGFLCLGMLAGVDGPGGIAFDDYLLTQGVGIACLIFILFSGGIDTDWRDVRRVATPALVLATGGVLISAGIMALAANLLLGFSPYQGFLLGAIIASTDAAAVFAILRSTGLDLHGDVPALIEVESGSNDPMAIFLVGAALMFITVPDFSPITLVPQFLLQMVLGAAVGFGAGYLLPEILKRSQYRHGGLAFVISIAAALIAYGLASVLGGNGFLAAYVAGLTAGNRTYRASTIVSTFQDGLAWLAQVVMFLTLGLLITPSNLTGVIVPGLAITFILMFIARPVSVFVCLAPFRQFGWRAKLFVSWAGLRGAVPIVLATFPIVAGVPSAFTIFNIVFFVVLLSSVIQGPTINWLANRLGLRAEQDVAGPVPADDAQL